MAWWVWLLVGWVGLSVLVAPLLGLALGEADRRERASLGLAPLAGAPARRRRRRIPLPPVAAAALFTGVVLESVGLVVRTSGSERGAARLWAMDLPLSVPRMYVAGLFAVAALAALLGATRSAGRRPWWVAVGLVALLIAQVKAGGTVHVRALDALGVGGRPVVAALVSAAVVGVVLAALWGLSRNDRRDRRRVLTAFAVYAVAAVGLSGVSSLVGQSSGSAFLGALATYAEEVGEVMGAVAVLTAVLIGVAPRLALPAAWALRRRADAETIEATEPRSAQGWRLNG